jgi:hypothetical protein
MRNRLRTDTNAPISLWNTIILDITTGRSAIYQYSITPHANKKTATTLITSFTRENSGVPYAAAGAPVLRSAGSIAMVRMYMDKSVRRTHRFLVGEEWCVGGNAQDSS